jgi:hypothetical protein
MKEALREVREEMVLRKIRERPASGDLFKTHRVVMAGHRYDSKIEVRSWKAVSVALELVD